MARGKHSSAALYRRYSEAEQDIRDWKRLSAQQKREIERLTREVEHTRALQERCSVLEMELQLATGPEVRRLNEMVNDQRERLDELTQRYDKMDRLKFKAYDKIILLLGGAKSPAHKMQLLVRVLGPDLNAIDPELMPYLEDALVHPGHIPRRSVDRLGHEAVERIERARGRR